MAAGVVVIIAAIFILSGVKILNEYQRAVIFRLGRLMRYRGPGIIYVIPLIERMVRIDLRTVVLDVPPQDVITKDNVTVKVSATKSTRASSRSSMRILSRGESRSYSSS